MTSVAAVILAGGKGERLGGVNKALLEIGGRRLLDRARGAVAGCTPILLSVGATPIDADGLRSIPDLPGDHGGPLAGVAAAVEALRGTGVEALLSLAVDTPFFPHDFRARALPLLERVDAVIGCYGDQDYPTNGLWRVAAIRSLPDELRTGSAPHSLKRLAANLGAVRLDYRRLVDEDPFANANTPQDIENLELRARRDPAG